MLALQVVVPVGNESPYALNTPRYSDRMSVSAVTVFSYWNVIFVNSEAGNIFGFIIQLVSLCSQECKNVYSGIL
jgi:hypothetical protein